MMRTPTKPTTTAKRRRAPTGSPSNGIDSSVMKSGATKNNAVASASGITARAAKKVMFAVTIRRPRRRCSPGCFVRSIRKPPSNCRINRLKDMPIAERTKII